MQVILDVVDGPRKGASFVFDRHDTFIVGRSRFVHCAMPEDSALSRDHFLIEVNPPRCELRDLGSTNGTFVNDERVEPARLGPGDRISAGQSVFVVRFEGDAAEGVVGGEDATIVVAAGRRADPPAPAAACRRRRASTSPATDATADIRGSATSAGASRRTTPSPSPTTRSSASSAGARWASSTRPGTTRPAGWSRSS